MFHKPFRVKSQSAIKGSDRKKLRAQIKAKYPGLDDEKLKEIIPNKEEMTIMKLYTHAGDNVMVYCLHKNPVFFEFFGAVYPTVYTLWQHPDLLTFFTTWPPVFQKLLGGADLMLPGVIVKGQPSPVALGHLKKGDPCAVNLLGNRAAVAVGKTALSCCDMFEAAMRGKGVIILHTYKDQLWAHGDQSHPPLIEDPQGALTEQNGSESPTDVDRQGASNCDQGSGTERDQTSQSNPVTSVCDGEVESRVSSLELGAEEVDQVSHTQDKGASGGFQADTQQSELTPPDVDQQGAEGGQQTDELDVEETADPRTAQDKMDELLNVCFLSAIKSRVKEGDLPLLTSKFFKVHLQPCCPKNETLDIKKSSYKKLGKYLNEMEQKGFIELREYPVGVESITKVNWNNPELRQFVVPKIDTEPEEIGAACGGPTVGKCVPPQIEELYSVTANLITFFSTTDYKKGSALSIAEVRAVIVDYVKSNELQDSDQRGLVTLDPVLSDVALNKGEYITQLNYEELLNRCLNKMSPVHRITYPGMAPIVKKGKVQSVVVNVMPRGGKKVTLVENLEQFGLDPKEIAHRMQLDLACSTSVSALPGKNKGSQVMVQGNQVNYIGKLLIDHYQVKRKYIEGLEKGPKSGKRR